MGLIVIVPGASAFAPRPAAPPSRRISSVDPVSRACGCPSGIPTAMYRTEHAILPRTRVPAPDWKRSRRVEKHKRTQDRRAETFRIGDVYASLCKEALTLHLARSEGHERYLGCNLMQRKVLASSHQHLMAEAPKRSPRKSRFETGAENEALSALPARHGKRAEFWHRTGSHPARWSPGPGMHALMTSSAEPLGQGRVLQNLTYTARQIIRAIELHQKRVSPVSNAF